MENYALMFAATAAAAATAGKEKIERLERANSGLWHTWDYVKFAASPFSTQPYH